MVWVSTAVLCNLRKGLVSRRRWFSCSTSRYCVCATLSAIVTLGFGKIVRILLLNNTEITGSERHQSDPQTDAVWSGVLAATPAKAAGIPSANFFGVKYGHPTGCFPTTLSGSPVAGGPGAVCH